MFKYSYFNNKLTVISFCIFYSYGLQQGKEVTKVLGVKKDDKFGFVALVRYGDGEEYELVPTNVSSFPFQYFNGLGISLVSGLGYAFQSQNLMRCTNKLNGHRPFSKNGSFGPTFMSKFRGRVVVKLVT